MCGIAGYVGKTQQAGPLILDSLAKMEYRGYDSTGMAVMEGGEIRVAKAPGRLSVLENMTRGGNTLPGTCGIGHTRWATHGVPSAVNAHPHTNADNTVAIVMNGIIENYIPLKEQLIKHGYTFESETDTEVLCKLIDYYYEMGERKHAVRAIRKVMHRVEGSYAMAVIVSRALPDVRDGLKPVHRRILYSMNELGVTPDKPYRKSARIVGEAFANDRILLS